ncbi:MAG TPA: sulfur carrier protein ThiS [Kribbellaceae bacterium]|nr:sulfur carrier protein ThiS [Kribbellaceae bacterium]
MKVFVNGSAHDLAPGSSVAEVVAGWSRTDQGVAVAVNDQVVSRGSWSEVELAEGDRVEILTAVQGG